MDVWLLAGLAVFIVAVLYKLVPVHRKMRRKKKHRLLHLLSECGSRHNLSFSSQELLHNRVLGLDGMHRKLVLLQLDYRGLPEVHVIDLNEVAGCCVTKQYRRMEPTEPARVALRFDFNTAAPALEIPFYTAGQDTSVHGQQLEQKARDWSMIISKMLDKSIRRIA